MPRKASAKCRAFQAAGAMFPGDDLSGSDWSATRRDGAKT